MRCYYREKQYICGDYTDVQIYPVYAKAKQRRSKAKPTSEAQEKLNEKNKHQRLSRLIHTNFTSRDMALHLTYADEYHPESPERAKKDIQNFLKKLGRRYSKLGKELKYIWVCETGKRSGRIHFHVTLSEGLSRDAIESLWQFGYANTKRLKFTEDGLTGLSVYMTKQQLLFKSWSASRNLKKPVEKQNDYKYSASAVKEIVEQDMILDFCKNYPGFGISDFETVANGNNGGYYISARLYRLAVFENIRMPMRI